MKYTKISNVLLFASLLAIALSSLTWVPWTFTVISQPAAAHATGLFFIDSKLIKESTFTLYFEIEVIQDSYRWSGVKSIALDNGRVLHGTWKVSPNGLYKKNDRITVQFSMPTGGGAESFVAIFTDASTKFQLKFTLPPYQGAHSNQALGNLLGQEGQRNQPQNLQVE